MEAAFPGILILLKTFATFLRLERRRKHTMQSSDLELKVRSPSIAIGELW